MKLTKNLKKKKRIGLAKDEKGNHEEILDTCVGKKKVGEEVRRKGKEVVRVGKKVRREKGKEGRKGDEEGRIKGGKGKMEVVVKKEVIKEG